MNRYFDEYRRNPQAEPLYLIVIRLHIGVLVLLKSDHQFNELEVGMWLGDLVDDDSLIFDESAMRLLYVGNRVIKFFDPTIFSSIQENLGTLQRSSQTNRAQSFRIRNNDQFFSKLWAQEEILTAECVLKFGFVGLPYIYFRELSRSTIQSITYDKDFVEISVI